MSEQFFKCAAGAKVCVCETMVDTSERLCLLEKQLDTLRKEFAVVVPALVQRVDELERLVRAQEVALQQKNKTFDLDTLSRRFDSELCTGGGTSHASPAHDRVGKRFSLCETLEKWSGDPQPLIKPSCVSTSSYSLEDVPRRPWISANTRSPVRELIQKPVPRSPVPSSRLSSLPREWCRVVNALPEPEISNPIASLQNFAKHYLELEVEFEHRDVREEDCHQILVRCAGHNLGKAMDRRKSKARESAAKDALQNLHSNSCSLLIRLLADRDGVPLPSLGSRNALQT